MEWSNNLGKAVAVELDPDDPEFKAWIAGLDPAAEFAAATARTAEFAPTLIGVNEADARAQTETHGFLFRVIRRDRTSFVRRLDRRPNRINVVVENATITSAEVY